MSKYIDHESKGWQCARNDLFDRMVTNVQANKEKLKQGRPLRSHPEEESLTLDQLLEYEFIATRDQSTGIYNTRYIAHKLVKEVHRGKRYKRPFSLMLISLTNFEQANKKFGEWFADDFLKTAIKVISSSIREVDILGRFSEDKLALILPETDSSRATTVSSRICKNIAGVSINKDLAKAPIFINIGLVAFPTHARDENSLLTTALEYLELAKQNGNNQMYTS